MPMDRDNDSNGFHLDEDSDDVVRNSIQDSHRFEEQQDDWVNETRFEMGPEDYNTDHVPNEYKTRVWHQRPTID
jgi:hypothetical protein